MKKTFVIILVLMLSAPVFAGDIGAIMGSNLFIGAVGGAAMGCALSVPSYMEGSNVRVFAAGGGWGALIGSGLGLAYGVYAVILHIDMRNKSKAGIEGTEPFLAYNPEKTGFEIKKTF
ncbi:MAG: hypothetical protein LLG37_04570 [Spirochaetia bacterium]|nr:hypothetical protein [Spirochaetia bacterium]